MNENPYARSLAWTALFDQGKLAGLTADEADAVVSRFEADFHREQANGRASNLWDFARTWDREPPVIQHDQCVPADFTHRSHLHPGVTGAWLFPSEVTTNG